MDPVETTPVSKRPNDQWGPQQARGDLEASTAQWLDCERCFQQKILNTTTPTVAVLESGLSVAKSKSDECCSVSSHDSTPVWLRTTLGSLLGLTAGVFLTVGTLLNGSVTSMGAMQTCSARSLFAALFLAPPLGIFRPVFNVDGRMHLELVALSGVFACKFLAFSYGAANLPVAEFSLLANTVPIYTAVLSCAIMRERCFTKALITCAAVSAGIVTVILPALLPNDNVAPMHRSRRAVAYASTLLSALTNAIALVWLRRLGSVSALWVSLYASVASMMLAGAAAGVFDSLSVPTASDLALAAAAGVCTLMQSYLPALACVLAEPARVAISMTLAVAFSFVIQVAVEKRQPSPSTCFGGLVIVLALIACQLHWDRFLCCSRRFRTRSQSQSTSVSDARDRSDEEALLSSLRKPPTVPRPRYGAVALIGSPDSCRLCATCRLAT